jgi:hypothetical protein
MEVTLKILDDHFGDDVKFFVNFVEPICGMNRYVDKIAHV